MVLDAWLNGFIFGVMLVPFVIGIVWVLSTLRKLGFFDKIKREKKQ